MAKNVAQKTWRWFLVAGLAFAAGLLVQVSFRSETAEAQYPQQQQQVQQRRQPAQQAQQPRRGLSECFIMTLYKNAGPRVAAGQAPRTISIAGWRPIGGTEDGVVLCR